MQGNLLLSHHSVCKRPLQQLSALFPGVASTLDALAIALTEDRSRSFLTRQVRGTEGIVSCFDPASPDSFAGGSSGSRFPVSASSDRTHEGKSLSAFVEAACFLFGHKNEAAGAAAATAVAGE